LDIKAKIYEIEKDKTKADKLWRYIVMMIQGEETSFQVEYWIKSMYDLDVEGELNVSIEDIFEWVDDYLAVPDSGEKKTHNYNELKNWEDFEDEEGGYLEGLDEEDGVKEDLLEEEDYEEEESDDDNKIKIRIKPDKKYQRLENIEFLEKKKYNDYTIEIYGEVIPDDSENYSVGLGIADRVTDQYVYIVPKVLKKITDLFE